MTLEMVYLGERNEENRVQNGSIFTSAGDPQDWKKIEKLLRQGVEVHIRPIKDENGNVLGAVCAKLPAESDS